MAMPVRAGPWHNAIPAERLSWNTEGEHGRGILLLVRRAHDRVPQRSGCNMDLNSTSGPSSSPSGRTSSPSIGSRISTRGEIRPAIPRTEEADKDWSMTSNRGSITMKKPGHLRLLLQASVTGFATREGR